VVGLISRMQLVDRFARPYRRELLAKRRCTAVMDEAAVIVDVEMPLRDLARVVASAGSETSGEGFVVTDAGRYLGVQPSSSASGWGLASGPVAARAPIQERSSCDNDRSARAH
jgi:hypothetical protein